jgi:hypothetical protein
MKCLYFELLRPLPPALTFLNQANMMNNVNRLMKHHLYKPMEKIGEKLDLLNL